MGEDRRPNHSKESRVLPEKIICSQPKTENLAIFLQSAGDPTSDKQDYISHAFYEFVQAWFKQTVGKLLELELIQIASK